jgi:Cell Wall Hydrolase
MVIRRPQPPKGGHTTKARTFVAASLVALTMTSMTQVNATYTPIGGYRGHSLTIPLDPPRPIAATQTRDLQLPENILPAAFNPGDPSIYAPVPLPEPIISAMPVSPTPSAFPMGPGVPVAPFVMPSRYSTGLSALPYAYSSGSSIDSMRAAMCLTSAIYYEAASESDDGQRAVAQVVLNRVRHPAWPNTVCGVVYQGSDRPGCQFSFACDGSMARRPVAAAWARAARHARAALAGFTFAPVGLSTFYHTPAVNPSWNKRLIVSNMIGNHIFYRMPGEAGGLRSFYGRYAGGEPIPAPKPRAYAPPSFVPMPRMAQAQIAPYPLALAPSMAYPTALSPVSAPVPLPNQSVGYAGKQAPAVREDNRYVAGSLPESDINPKYRDSGTWIAK